MILNILFIIKEIAERNPIIRRRRNYEYPTDYRNFLDHQRPEVSPNTRCLEWSCNKLPRTRGSEVFWL